MSPIRNDLSLGSRRTFTVPAVSLIVLFLLSAAVRAGRSVLHVMCWSFRWGTLSVRFCWLPTFTSASYCDPVLLRIYDLLGVVRVVDEEKARDTIDLNVLELDG